MVLALERVAEEDDKLKGRVRVNGEIQIAAGHLVDLVNDEDTS